jgi:hypothetical protein
LLDLPVPGIPDDLLPEFVQGSVSRGRNEPFTLPGRPIPDYVNGSDCAPCRHICIIPAIRSGTWTSYNN